MSRLMKRHRQQHPVLAKSGGFSLELRPFGRLRSHSCLCPLQKPADAHKGAVEARLEQGFFGSKVGLAKPLLQAMNPQHHRKIKRRAARLGRGACGVWRDQREQFAPRHDLLHFIEQDLLVRAPADEIKAKVFLFHAVVDRNLRASVKQLGAEF